MMSVPFNLLRVVCWSAITAAIVIVNNQYSGDRAMASDPPRIEPLKPTLPVDLHPINLWARVLGKTNTPSPWRVSPCNSQSKAPLLCVYDRNALVGTVEMGTFLLSSRADFRKNLMDAGIPPKANYADLQYRSRLIMALKAWVDDYYTTFKNDRVAEYGKTITFTTQPPTQVMVGTLPGLRYGFAGMKQNKGIHEQHLGYVAFDGSTLYVITTAFDPMSETGKFKTLVDFQRFEPYLTKLLPKLKLPIAAPSTPSATR